MVEEMRRLMKEYNILESEVDQKAIRAEVYKKTGSFGKAILPLSVRFAEIETELEKK